MRSILDLNYGKSNDPAQVLDIFMPDWGDNFPVLVYFHGGGLEGGDKRLLKIANSLVKRGIVFVTANYRMYPTAKYPEFIEDAAEAVSFVFENISNYCTPRGIYVGGSSAGGYLSLMLCFDRKWLAKYNISPMDISGFIHDAGQPTTHFNVLKEKGIDPKRIVVNEAAPLYHIGEDKEYPRMLIIVSDKDMENRYEQTLLTASTLKHFGHREDKVKLLVKNGGHCHYLPTFEENGENSFAKMVADYIES